MDEFLTVSEVAKRLKLHPETIARYIRQGELQALKFGRVWRMEKKRSCQIYRSNKAKNKEVKLLAMLIIHSDKVDSWKKDKFLAISICKNSSFLYEFI